MYPIRERKSGICMVLQFHILVWESMSAGPLTLSLSKLKEKRERVALRVFAGMKAGLRNACVLPYAACLWKPWLFQFCADNTSFFTPTMSVKIIVKQTKKEMKGKRCHLVSPGFTKLRLFFFSSVKCTRSFSRHEYKKEMSTPAILLTILCLQGTGGVNLSIAPCLQSLVGRCLPSSLLLGKGTGKTSALLVQMVQIWHFLLFLFFLSK